MNHLVRLCLNRVVGLLFFFRFLCSCHAQVGQSSEQAARGEKRGSLKREVGLVKNRFNPVA